MEEKRARGQRHLKNKQKYKSRKQDLNTPVNVVPKPIVDLDSNWDRYEDEDDIAIPSGTDFALLASAPIKPSGRFQLKSDKTTMEQIENANTTDNFFDLDLDLLSSSLSAIPFHERLGIDEDYFPNGKLLQMKNDANANLLEYNKKIGKSKDSVQCTNASENDLTTLVTNMTIPDENQSITVVSKVDDELEQWLDDILDD